PPPGGHAGRASAARSVAGGTIGGTVGGATNGTVGGTTGRTTDGTLAGRAHVVTVAVTATTAATTGRVAATDHCRAVAAPAACHACGIRPFQPRARIASQTRSPRSYARRNSA